MNRIDVHGNEWQWVRVASLVRGDRVIHENSSSYSHLTVAEPYARGCWVATDGGIVSGYEADDTIERLIG